MIPEFAFELPHETSFSFSIRAIFADVLVSSRAIHAPVIPAPMIATSNCLFCSFMLILRPVFRPFNIKFPLTVFCFTHCLVHFRCKDMVNLPEVKKFFFIMPVAYCKTCEKCGTCSCCLNVLRTVYRGIQNVGLELHHDIADAGTAVDFYRRDPASGIFLHT